MGRVAAQQPAQVFKVPDIVENSDGWGPLESSSSSSSTASSSTTAAALAAQQSPLLYAPFAKNEKLGRAADWGRSYPARGMRGGGESVFDFVYDEADEESFKAVDGKPPPRRNYSRWRPNQRMLPQRKDEELEAKRREAEKERQRRDKQYNQNRTSQRREAAAFKSSVDIQPEWAMLDQIPFTTFSKLSFNVGEPEDLAMCGALEYYDKLYDRVTPKSDRRLERFKNRNFFKVTTSDDPVIRRLASEDKATVFATDTILSTLMCAPRSVYSWDIVVQRVGNKLFFDKRDNSQLDLLSVNETCQEPLPEAKEDINSAHSLSVEAAYVNQNFSQQVLVRGGAKVQFQEPNPFAGDSEVAASVAYRYRRWKLDEETFLVARCELHSVMESKNGSVFLTLNALNEFDPKLTGVDWRQKLETQRGAVLATELKNNANKLAKWTAQALLASADVMKLGYVSRIHPRDHSSHTVLSVQGHKPKDFAAQINLNTNNMWGIVKSIVDVCLKLAEGKYVLVKDPQKPQVRLYLVPSDAFENDYVEEPLPEEEQVPPPPAEEEAAAKPSEEKEDADV